METPKNFKIIAIIFGTLLAAAILYALITGDMSKFNNTYLQ